MEKKYVWSVALLMTASIAKNSWANCVQIVFELRIAMCAIHTKETCVRSAAKMITASLANDIGVIVV